MNESTQGTSVLRQRMIATKCPTDSDYQEARNGQPYTDDGKSNIGSSGGHGT
jgi:hypothetical protein